MNSSIHAYPSTFAFESRILKQTSAIIESKVAENITILAIQSDELPHLQKIDQNRHVVRFKLLANRIPLRPVAKLISKLEFIIRCIYFISKNPCTWIHCHSCETLLVGVFGKLFRGSKLIYDTHELETERTGLRGIYKTILKIIERLTIPIVDYTFVVGQSIGEWYVKKYRLKHISVVRNIPEIESNRVSTNKILRSRIRVDSDQLIFLYQGALGRFRGIEVTLDAWKQVDPNKHLVFLGYGELTDLVRTNSNGSKNIHFLDAVSPSELPNYTADANIGLAIIEEGSLSYSLCLPNKLFEYLASGLPVIISNRSEMVRIVSKYNCGWVVSENPSDLAKLINSIDLTEIQSKIKGAIQASEENTWQSEKAIYVSGLQSLNHKVPE